MNISSLPASYLNPWHIFPSSAPPAPPIAHKVFILDCKKCKLFLSNRGMKAVLLLRPNVALYSSDALPVNCSAYTSNPNALRPAAACPSSSAHPLRTCECLTQTLCCHGCGGNVGYMIVVPCTRCTSSISTTNRATNGHRFVFHSSEITGTERHYIPGEPGVIVTQAPPSAGVLPAYTASALHNGLLRNPSVYHTHHSQSLAAAPRPEYLPTPPLDIEDISPASSNPTSPSFPFPQDSSHLSMDSPDLPHSPYPVLHSSDHFHAHYPRSFISNQPHHRATSGVSSESSDSSPPPLIHPGYSFGLPSEQLEPPALPPLRAGDVLYWHHLARHGEIPGVMEDARARRRSLAINVGKTRILFDR
ncbi:FAM72 protein-domain-containing protein [Mycena galericulata]|nr:FAM72 protein-domain-containing protein [Mycena galericulata]